MLMAGSTTRLLFQIVLAMLLLAFWGWVAPSVSGFGRVSLLFVMACLLHSLLLAVQLIDLPTPVISAGANGIVLSGKLSRHDLIYWDEVKQLKVIELHWPVKVPLLSYLVIRTGKASHFTGLSRLAPTSWFGIYLLPTRMLKGGARAARQWAGTIGNIREGERHDAVGNNREFMSDTSLAWAMLRNSTFPLARTGRPTKPLLPQRATVCSKRPGFTATCCRRNIAKSFWPARAAPHWPPRASSGVVCSPPKWLPRNQRPSVWPPRRSRSPRKSRGSATKVCCSTASRSGSQPASTPLAALSTARTLAVATSSSMPTPHTVLPSGVVHST